MTEKIADSRTILSAASLDSCETWTMPAFTADNLANHSSSSPLTAKQLGDIHAIAHQDGFQAGHKEGFATGQADVAAKTQQLEVLLQGMQKPITRVDNEVEQALLNLTMTVAKHLFRKEISTDPAQALTIIQDVIKQMTKNTSPAKLFLNSEDKQLLEQSAELTSFDAEKLQLIVKAELSNGECLLETDVSLIDATLSARVEELMKKLCP